ncbi:MAG TPA: alpha/beta hydrolase [Terriglobia bacterium]|nr:alpha/beta hydrolase [Terriglobia bacterium]
MLLPGMDGTGKLFSKFIAALPETFEAVAVSYPTQQYLHYANLENFVRANFPIPEAYMLVAESFSTPLALKYAATNPANLLGVVLCAGFATSPLRGWRRFLASLVAPFVFYVPMPNLVLKRWLVGTDAPLSLMAAVRAAISSVPPRVLAARLRAVLACDVRAEAGRITAPILYIYGKQDRLISASCLEELRQIKPQIVVVAMEGPHLLLQREPRRAAEAVVGFVQLGQDSGGES